jgi:D-glycero-D-manno-heptose 1,7-bisphosphate phosphatase
VRPSLVILDRDGVINELWTDPDLALIDSPRHPEEVKLKPGVAGAIRRLNDAKIPVAVASNQPGVAKRKLTEAHLGRVTNRIVSLLAEEGTRLDAISYCLHHPDAMVEELRVNCGCRKPEPGMLIALVEQFGSDPATTYFVGDTHRDIEAANRAGIHAIWLGQRRCDVCPATLLGSHTYPDLTGFVESVLTS